MTPTRDISLAKGSLPSSRFFPEMEKQIKDVTIMLLTDDDITKVQDNFFVDRYWDILLHFFNIESKKYSRLGMYDTATTFIFNLSIDSIIGSNDSREENGDLTTHGSSLISLSKAKGITEKLELDETSSGFQIRYSGFKGAISCTHDNDLQLEEKNFLMRKSMKKFKNENQKFCVNTKKFIGTEKSQIFLFF